ncbi:DNA polymerase III subunit delta [Cryomorphaceae bacterium]|nr:DNA polymerase III subunit delta [Cryomorphaceae bacterium]
MDQFNQLVHDLKAGKYAPIYFLMGEEPFFIDEVVHFIEENALEESERSFNQTILYGKETDIDTVVSEAKRFPMMAERQVVILKEAQHLRKWDALEHYVEQPQPTTILIIAHKYKSFDKRKALFKKLTKSEAMVMESKKMYDDKVPGWVEQRVHQLGFTISFKAAALLVEFLGNDLGKIAKELEKLSILLKPGAEITPQFIEVNIGISKDYNNFELQNALGAGDIEKSNRIIDYFAADPSHHPIVVTLGVLYNFFSKLLIYHSLKDRSRGAVASALKVNPYFVAQYQQAAQRYSLRKSARVIGYLREADVRSKGVGNVSTAPHDLLRELVFKVLH